MASWLKGPIQIRQFLIRTAKSPNILYNHYTRICINFDVLIYSQSSPFHCFASYSYSLTQNMPPAWDKSACRMTFAKKHLHHLYTHVSVCRRTWHPNRRDDCSRIEYYRFVVWQEARTPQTLKHVDCNAFKTPTQRQHKWTRLNYSIQGHFPYSTPKPSARQLVSRLRHILCVASFYKE